MTNKVYPISRNAVKTNSLKLNSENFKNSTKKVGNRTKKRKLVIVNKFRFIFATALTLLLIGFLFNFTGSIMSEASTNQKIIEIRVASGDTLWAIASEYNYYNKDIREVVYEIKKVNQITSSNIYPGQILKIPVSK